MKQLLKLYRSNDVVWFTANLLAFLAWTVTIIFMMSIIIVAFKG